MVAHPEPSPPFGPAIDRDSLEKLINQHYEGLRLLLTKKVRDPQTAADILNGAITKSLEHLLANRISNPDQLAGWVYRVAINDLRNYLRNMHTRGNVPDGEQVLDSLPGDADATRGVAETKMASVVRAIIEQLPTERDRLIIKRFYLDEADKEEICREQQNLSPLHFDKIIHRARARMKELLEKRGLRRNDFFMILCIA